MTVRLLAIVGLILAFTAGRQATAGRLGVGAHTAVGLLAAGLSVSIHFRSGTGLDLAATLLLLLAAGLGVFVQGGAVAGHIHLAAAVVAVVVSAAVHAMRIRERLRT
jgi:hypothetical protein